jgi:hypothetical protein
MAARSGGWAASRAWGWPVRSELGRGVALALLLAGCSRGAVHDLSVSSDPLLVLHGHVDIAHLQRQHPDVPLVAALVWAGVPRINPLCLKYDAAAIQPACPDPYGFFYGDDIGFGAPVAADGSFALPQSALPKVSVSVGDEVTRIAYGTLLVVEDVNRDGQPTLLAAPGRRDGIVAPVDAGPPLPEPDAIVAATFYSLHAEQQRVVFREGGFVEGSNFYPAPGCGTPPPGFSILHAPAYTGVPAAPGACSYSAAAATVEVPPLPPEAGAAFVCRVIPRGFRYTEPVSNEPPAPGAATVCLAHEVLAVVSSGICPRLGAYLLKGCDDDPFCTTPWDRTNPPPGWWPCP